MRPSGTWIRYCRNSYRSFSQSRYGSPESCSSVQESPRTKVHYTSSFCRLLLHHPEYFVQFFERMSRSPQNTAKCDLLQVCLPLFLEKVRKSSCLSLQSMQVDSMVEPRRRKATILALLGLIISPSHIGNKDLFDFFRLLVIQAIGSVIVRLSLSHSF